MGEKRYYIGLVGDGGPRSGLLDDVEKAVAPLGLRWSSAEIVEPRYDANGRRRFTVKITGFADLTADDLWPDGDCPENPTVTDAAKVLGQEYDAYGVAGFLREWNHDLCVLVSCGVEEVRL